MGQGLITIFSRPPGGCAKKGPVAGAFRLLQDWMQGLHHATHAAATATTGRRFVLRQFSDHGFGRDHEAGDVGKRQRPDPISLHYFA